MVENTTVITVTNLKIGDFREHLGIGLSRPAISWQTTTGVNNWRQEAYEIECHLRDGHSVGTTGRVESEQSVLIDWPFEPLESRMQVSLKVRVWGTDGTASE